MPRKKHNMNPKSLANLEKRPLWKPGQTGNPAGYSISMRWKELLMQPCPTDEQGRTWLEVIAETSFKQAQEKPEALKIVLDRTEGPVSQVIAFDADKPLLVDLLQRIQQAGDDTHESHDKAPIMDK